MRNSRISPGRRPSHVPAEIARRVADGVVGDGLTVVGRQQITPRAVAVGVADRIERRAKLAGGVVIFALTQDIAAGIIFVGKRLALRRAVVANQLVFTIVGILFAQRIVLVRMPCAFGSNIAIGIIHIIQVGHTQVARGVGIVDAPYCTGCAARIAGPVYIAVRGGRTVGRAVRCRIELPRQAAQIIIDIFHTVSGRDLFRLVSAVYPEGLSPPGLCLF